MQITAETINDYASFIKYNSLHPRTKNHAFRKTEKQVTEDVTKYVKVEVVVLNEFGGDSVTAGLF